MRIKSPLRLILLIATATVVTTAILAQWRGISVQLDSLRFSSAAGAFNVGQLPLSQWRIDLSDETTNRVGYFALPSSERIVPGIWYVSIPWWVLLVLLGAGWCGYWWVGRKRRQRAGFPIFARDGSPEG